MSARVAILPWLQQEVIHGNELVARFCLNSQLFQVELNK